MRDVTSQWHCTPTKIAFKTIAEATALEKAADSAMGLATAWKQLRGPESRSARLGGEARRRGASATPRVSPSPRRQHLASSRAADAGGGWARLPSLRLGAGSAAGSNRYRVGGPAGKLELLAVVAGLPVHSMPLEPLCSPGASAWGQKSLPDASSAIESSSCLPWLASRSPTARCCSARRHSMDRWCSLRTSPTVCCQCNEGCGGHPGALGARPIADFMAVR
mmetsp:Transcript_127891/g.355924  ORF Transcript_127891/g.355924 Transcript_127891/m.355924 type:complete len:222 (+) Transcript_127891:92-757(+)